MDNRQVNGEAREIFKDPITDNGTKKSLKGLICVKKNEAGQFYAIDQVSAEEERTGELKTVFKDGKLIKDWTLDEIRNNVNSTINV